MLSPRAHLFSFANHAYATSSRPYTVTLHKPAFSSYPYFKEDRRQSLSAGCRPVAKCVTCKIDTHCWMHQSGKLPVLNLLKPSIKFFAPQGRLVAPIYVKFGMADGHLGLLGCAKFHPNRHGVEMQPPK